jgi:uncharacterized protein
MPARHPRLDGLDIARFLGFVGMVLVNFRIAAEVSASSDLAGLITTALEGRAAALFVVLAGIGLALGRPNWRITARRALFLFVVGLANLTIFEADILHFYALYFLVALPFLTATRPTLILLALAAVVLGTIGLILFDYEAGWDWKALTYDGLWTLPGFLRHSLYNGWHPVLPWVGFLFWGMALGRLDLGARAMQLGLLAGGAVAAIAFGALSGLFAGSPELRELLGTAPLPPGPLYMLAAGASATAIIGAVLLATPAITRLHVAPLLAAPGRQTLTLYVAHILLGMGTLEAMGRLDGSLSSSQIFAISLGFCAIAALYGWAWSRIFRRGPLEALMRLVTEGSP